MQTMVDISRRLFLSGALSVAAVAVVGPAMAAIHDYPVLYGDGKRDDTAALQALFDGLPVIADGVVIDPMAGDVDLLGTYRTTRPLLIGDRRIGRSRAGVVKGGLIHSDHGGACLFQHFPQRPDEEIEPARVEDADREWKTGGSDPLRHLPKTLADENGAGFGFVCIWRPKRSDGNHEASSVGEFLSRPENQSGTWLIDGGWGGPPGPIHVRWNDAEAAWENGGFNGKGFAP